MHKNEDSCAYVLTLSEIVDCGIELRSPIYAPLKAVVRFTVLPAASHRTVGLYRVRKGVRVIAVLKNKGPGTDQKAFSAVGVLPVFFL